MAATHTQHTSWQLARLAECADPDEHDGRGFSFDQDIRPRDGSDGAQYLRQIEDSAFEILDNADDYAGHPGDTLAERADYNGTLHEYADGAVPVYTHERWQTFVDLAAYNEDTDELAGAESDMTERAGIALYMIAERLLRAILDEHETDDDDDDDD